MITVQDFIDYLSSFNPEARIVSDVAVGYSTGDEDLVCIYSDEPIVKLDVMED